jgi:hypothetical protein
VQNAHATPESAMPLPPGMPPLPQIVEEPGPPKSATDLLAGYRSVSKPRGADIKGRITRAVGVAKKQGLAMKLGHEAKNLQAAIDTQLETLGTLTLTHRPAAVSISEEIAELSQVQDGLSQKQSTLDALRQTKGSGPVVKELSKEVAQLHIRQKAAMVAIGRKALRVRPDMPGAAGCYAALDRLHSSLAARQGELKAIEDEIGPAWHTSGMSLGATKRPLLLVGAAAGGLLLVCLLWKLLVATLSATGLLGSGYQVDYKQSLSYQFQCNELDVTVKGKAAKLAVMLTDSEGHTETRIIEENEMIKNSATVSWPIAPPGTYVLTVKTFVPEGVVFKKEFRWPLETEELPRKEPRKEKELPRRLPREIQKLPAYDEPLPR